MGGRRLLIAAAIAGLLPLHAPRGMHAQQPPAAAVPVAFADHTGFTQIFDGLTLAGWDGAPGVWRAEAGAIVGESTPERPTGTTFIIWRGGQPSDFELKLEIKLEGAGGNSGIQYRSRQVLPDPNFGAGRGRAGGGAPGGGRGQGQNAGRGALGPAPNPEYQKWNLQGYQADFDVAGNMAGQLFEGGRFMGERGITTRPGQIVVLREAQPATLFGTLGTPDDLKAAIKVGDWNQYQIVVRGFTFLHFVNGRLVSVTIDDDKTKRSASGVIGLQIEGNNLKVSFRDIWLKTL